MGSIAIKDKNLLKYGDNTPESKVTDQHLFIVRNNEKSESDMYWRPVPGGVMAQFMTGDYEFRYVGPQHSKSVVEFLKKLEAKQKEMQEEQREKALGIDSDYQVDLSLEDIPLVGGEDERDALDVGFEELVAKPKRHRKPEAVVDFELDEKGE